MEVLQTLHFVKHFSLLAPYRNLISPLVLFIAEGVRILGYHRLGSVRYRGGWGGGEGGVGGGTGVERMRSGSDPLNLSSSVPDDAQEQSR